MKPTAEPKFDLDQFQDLIHDQDGKGHAAKIVYEYCYYERACHIYKCSVSTDYRHVTQEDVEELLHLREGKSIVFECQLEIV